MAATTGIEWTDRTWNTIYGCTKVSPECAHCYIPETPPFRKLGLRFVKGEIPLILHEDRLEQPLHWRKPQKVFVNSLSDTFHEDVPDEFIVRMFEAMEAAPHIIFQVLTKRPARMAEFVDRHRVLLPNVWLGTSIGIRTSIWRADVLREIPAAVRFVSAEPLLGPLVPAFHFGEEGTNSAYWPDAHSRPCNPHDGIDLQGIDWLIAGGESGRNHRRVDPRWVRDLRDISRLSNPTGTAFFFKQWGGRTPKAGGRELDGRTWEEFPVGDRVAA